MRVNVIPGNLIVKNGGTVYLDKTPEYNQKDVRKDGAADLVVDGGILYLKGLVRLGYDAILMDDLSEILIKEL